VFAAPKNETDDFQAKRKAERDRQRLLEGPPGRARIAYERGDQVFQYSWDVMSQEPTVTLLQGPHTFKEISDPAEILNAVVAEGWELVNGSFVFVEQGSEGRARFFTIMAGERIAVRGTTVGYYLFRRRAET
jgi:hypothetical protein